MKLNFTKIMETMNDFDLDNMRQQMETLKKKLEKQEIVNEIAKDLCVFFHQESVMITENNIRAYFIKETL